MTAALVLGGARCLFDDLEALGPWSDLVIATNDAGTVYPHRIHHWATLHPEKLPTWRLRRWANRGNRDYVTWTHSYKVGMADREIAGWTNGSSGLLAVGVALELGCDRVVLAGVPMDPQTHFFDRQAWLGYETHRKHWESRLGKLQGRVFSLSGWTSELLGSPRGQLHGSTDSPDMLGVEPRGRSGTARLD